MNIDANWLELLLRLALAIFLGALIGWERQSRRKPAGLQTNMMVSLGAATFTLMSMELGRNTGAVDPTRIVTGVATGIGFLGAGAIMHAGGKVEGLTTAASIWVVGAIGAACGAGGYLVAGVTALLTWLVLDVIGRWESKTFGSRSEP